MVPSPKNLCKILSAVVSDRFFFFYNERKKNNFVINKWSTYILQKKTKKTKKIHKMALLEIEKYICDKFNYFFKMCNWKYNS